MVKCSFLH